MEDRLRIYDQREVYYTKDDGTFCRCPICGIDFRKDAMKIHFLMHERSGFIHCRECNKECYFQDEKAASVHFEYHISQLSYTCNLCGVAAKIKEHIENHLRYHHEITYYRCSFCNKDLHSYEGAKHHMYSQHPETRLNETVIGSASSEPTLHDQIVRKDFSKTFLADGRAIQDLTCSANETVIDAASTFPILHDQIVCNGLDKTLLPDRRGEQNQTLSPTLISRYSVNIIQQEKCHIENILTKEQLPFNSNAENSRNKISHNDQSRSEKLMPSSIEENYSVQCNLSTGSHVDYPNQLSLVNSKLDVSQQSTYVCSNSNISGEVSSSGTQLDRQMPQITSQIQDDDKNRNAEEEMFTETKSEFCWEDVDDFGEKVTWSQQEGNDALTEDRKGVLDLVGEITLKDQWERNGNAASGEMPSVLSEFLQHYLVNADKVLECPVCEKMYDRNVLEEHFYTHHIERLVCTKCKRKFELPSYLYSHCLSKHNSVKPYECLSCDKSYKWKNFILWHLKKVHGIMYKCPQCNLRFKCMKDHNVRRCIGLKSKPVSSSLNEAKQKKCLRKTTKKSSLNSILSKGRQLSSSLKEAKQKKCLRKTTKKSSLNSILSKGRQLRSSRRYPLRDRPMTSNNSHLDSHKEVTSEDTELVDEVSCGAEDDVSFNERAEMSTRRLTTAAEVQPIPKQKDVLELVETKNNLKGSWRWKNGNAAPGETSEFLQHYSVNSAKIIECPVCEESYNANLLEEHFFTRHAKDRCCIKCKEVYITQTNLYDHYFGYHSSVRPIECSLCDKSFKLKGDIFRHLRVVHGIKCNSKFTSLKDHNVKTCKNSITKRHNNAVPSKEPSVYSDFLQHYSINMKKVLKCPKCQKSYKPHVLRKHFNTHIIEDPVCIKCKKIFKRKSDLHDHFITKHCSVKPYECAICDESFKLEKNITLHLRTYHDIKYRCPNCNLKFDSLKNHNVKRCNTIQSKLKSSAVQKIRKKKSVKKNMKQLRLSASSSSISSRNRQLGLSRRHSPRGSPMTSNDSQLNSHKEVTSEDTEEIEEVPSGAEDDDVSFHERAEVSTGRLMEAEVQQIRKQKDMLDTVEAEFDLKKSQGQKSGKKGLRRIPTVYSEFMKNYSVNKKAVIECPVCKKMYKFLVFKEHFDTHVVKNVFCTKCEKTFKYQCTYSLHYLSCHNSVRCFVCSLCDFSCKLKSQILNHLRIEHKIKYKCPECNLKFKSYKDHNEIRCRKSKSKSVSLKTVRNIQIKSSGRHSSKAMKKNSSFNHLNNRNEVTTQDIGTMEAESSKTQKDDVSFLESGEMSTGSRLMGAVQRKDMFDMEEAEIDLSESQRQKSGKGGSHIISSVYSEFLPHYSVNSEEFIKCPVCQEGYKAHIFKEHFFSHDMKSPACKKCKRTFTKQSMLYYHYISTHNSVNIFECSLCYKSFKLKSSIISHLRIEHDIKYKCHNCNLEFRSFKDHNIRRCKILNSKSKFEDIPETDEDKSVYSDFQKCYTVNNKLVYECPVCEERFTYGDLREHFDTHVLKNQGCTKCRKTFPNKPTLYCHYLCSHNSMKPFECSLCDDSFKIKPSIIKHLRIDHDIKYKCPNCNLRFASLKDHNARRCSIFKSISKFKDTSVYSDFQKCYTINSKTLLECPFCEERFTYYDLKEHLKTHVFKNQECTKCKQLYSDMSHFHTHYLCRHSSVKLFECLLCEKSFKLKNSIMIHLKTFHGIKYKCPQCNLKYLTLEDHNPERCSILKSTLKFSTQMRSKRIRYSRKNKEQYRQSASASVIPSKMKKIVSSGRDSIKVMQMTSSTSHLYNHKKVTSEDDGPMEAVTNRNQNEDVNSQKREEMSRVQLIRKRKGVLDLLDTKINLNESRRQKKSNATSSESGSLYSDYQQHYSVNTKKMLQCPVCEKMHKLNTIKKHIFSHGVKQRVCKKCKITFATWNRLFDHYLSFHNSVKPFECLLCPFSFKLKSNTLQHLRSVHGIKYKCPQCNLRFESLNDHNTKTCMEMTHTGSHSDKAMEMITNDSNLDNHEEMIPIKAHLSESISAASRRITKHDKFQERGKVLTGRCKATKEQTQLKSKDLHDIEEEEIDIDVPQENKNCAAASSDKIPSTYSNFMQHYCTDNEKVMKCPVCNESHKFFTMRKHLLTHDDIGPICVKCDKTFTSQHKLNTHYLKCHCKVKPFKCLKCNKCFQMKRNILHHLRTEHYIKYKCPKCNLEYESLKDHNVTNCNHIKLRIELGPLAQRKLKKRRYVIKNKPAVKEKMMKQSSRSFHENLKNTSGHRTVSESQIVSRKLYKRKLKKAIRKARQRDSNNSRSFNKRLNSKKDTKQPENLKVVESRSIQFTSPGSQEGDPASGNQEDEPSSGSQDDEPSGSLEDEPSSGSQEDEPSSGSQEDEPSSGSQEDEPSPGIQEDEPMQLIIIDDHSKKQKEMACAGISVNELMPTVSVKTISDDNFPREGEISTDFLGTPHVQSQLQFRNLIYNTNDTEQLERLSLPKDIASKSLQGTPSISQVTSIDNHSYEHTEISYTGIQANEFIPAGSIKTMKTLNNDNFPKGRQMSTGFLETEGAQTHFPFPFINRIYNKKMTEQPELSSFPGVIGSRNVHNVSSDNQVDESVQTISPENHLDKQREITGTGMHVNELSPAISKGTIGENNSPKGQQKSVGIIGTPDAQLQLSSKKRLYTKKNTEQLGLLHVQGDIGRRNVQVPSFDSQVDAPLHMISSDNHSYKQKEITGTGMHENELMQAVSMNTLGDDNSAERGHRSTGLVEKADTQSQHTPKGTQSNMLNLVETQINQNEPQSQRKSSLPPGKDISEYCSSSYIRNTKTIQECPVCYENCTPHSIKTHLQSHDGTEPICLICRKLYKHHGLLHDHYLTGHSSVKPFECLICDKSFKLKKLVFHHLATIHGINYEIPQCNKDLKCNAEPRNIPLWLPATIFENISKLKRQKECKTIESRYDTEEERSVMVQGTQEDTLSHKTGTNTTLGNKSCHKEIGRVHDSRRRILSQNTGNTVPMKAKGKESNSIAVKEGHMITKFEKNRRHIFGSRCSGEGSKAVVIDLTEDNISLSNVRDVSIPLESGSHCGVQISFRNKEEKGKQPWPCGQNHASITKPITLNCPNLRKTLIGSDCNTDAYMEKVQNNQFANLYSSDNRLDMEKRTLQKSTRTRYNEEYALALEQEAYFVSLWMTS